MSFTRSLGIVVIAGLLAIPLTWPLTVGAAEEQWEQQAEETFQLGRGMGRQLMTQEEWLEHRQKMQSLSPEERERYRQEWHKKMVERAQERGITMPETPGPHRGEGGMGTGPGKGMGPHRGGMRRGYNY